jgi:hypothetical protein
METPAPAPLPDGPLPALGASPKKTGHTAAPQSGKEISWHLKRALIYLGLILAICLSSVVIGEIAVGISIYAYWGALGIHVLVALALVVKSAMAKDWGAMGRHIVAVLLVAALAFGACWLNLAALSTSGALNGF